MKKSNILNPKLIAAIAELGHTEFIVIADAGLPIQPDVPVIDLSLVQGIPAFIDVVNAVSTELVIESFIYASELPEQNETVFNELKQILSGDESNSISGSAVSHGQFKDLVKSARYVVRTGESSPYANVILVGGVNF